MSQQNEKPKRVVEYSTTGKPMWAYVIIAIGIFWLLANLNIFASLWRLWPLILVAVGFLMIVGRLKATPAEHHHFTALLGNTKSARLQLHLPVGEAIVSALADSDALIDADLNHMGEVEFSVAGEAEKTIRLRPTEGFAFSWINPANWVNPGDRMRWEVRLSPHVPLDLELNNTLGRAELDLSKLQVTRLKLSNGIGELKAVFPAMAAPYDARVEGGTGETKITIPDGTAVNLTIRGGLGACTVDTPDDAAVRLEASVGVGDIKPPDWVQQVKGERHMIGESGVWETPDFASAERKITIRYEGGMGEFKLH